MTATVIQELIRQTRLSSPEEIKRFHELRVQALAVALETYKDRSVSYNVGAEPTSEMAYGVVSLASEIFKRGTRMAELLTPLRETELRKADLERIVDTSIDLINYASWMYALMVIQGHKEPIKDCVIFLLVREGKVLMENRPDLRPGTYPYWVYPGGKLEPGESWEEATIRECFEETGSHVLYLEPLGDVLVNPETRWNIKPFIVHTSGEDVAPANSENWAYIAPGTIANLAEDSSSERVIIAKRILARKGDGE